MVKIVYQNESAYNCISIIVNFWEYKFGHNVGTYTYITYIQVSVN